MLWILFERKRLIGSHTMRADWYHQHNAPMNGSARNHVFVLTNYITHTRLTALCPGLPG